MSPVDRISVHTGLEEPHRNAPDSPLVKLLEARLRTLGRTYPWLQHEVYDFWSASFFGLDQVCLYQDASDEQRVAIIDLCAGGLLNEAYFIEKAALSYCAKMILLAGTTEVKQAYSLIAADEASHLQWITPYVPEKDRSGPTGPFLQFLAGLVEECDANLLAYLVQVILEGWGLHHYRSLSNSCREPNLQRVFHHLYRDEAMHHRTGELVFDPRLVSGPQEEFIENALQTYTEFVRVGPQGVVSALEQILGGLSKSQKVKVFAELQTERVAAQKLGMLKNLMCAPEMEAYVAYLEEKRCFIPYEPSVCAALHSEERLSSADTGRDQRSTAAV